MSNVIDPNTDPYAFLGFKKNADGSLTRLPAPFPEIPASADPTNPLHLSKDIVLNQTKQTWVRLFVPRKSFDSNPGDEQHQLLPIVVYFHGGGFVMCSPATDFSYSIYDGLTTGVGPALIVSAKYRLAPEHRLPAAYEDAVEALHWVNNSSDEWLNKYGDVSRCYLMGSSAGGNICYHAGLRAALQTDDLKPLQIKGLILHHSAFGGQKRSASEVRLEHDMILPPVLCDIMWDLSLPMSANRDHEYCNPRVGIKKEIFDKMKFMGWKFLIIGCYRDPLIHREIEVAMKLAELGVPVVSKFVEGICHGYDCKDPTGIEELISLVKWFLHSP